MEMDIPKSLISVPTETKLKISDMIDDVLAGYECKEEERAWLEVQEEIKRQLDERLDKRKDDTMKNEDELFFTMGEQTAAKWLDTFTCLLLEKFGWDFTSSSGRILSAGVRVAKDNWRLVKSDQISIYSDVIDPSDYLVSYVANGYWKVRAKDE